MDLAYCKERLSAAGVLFDSGMTAEEFSRIEQEYGFRFPPDLREFLSYALPVSKEWIDWRHADRFEIEQRLEWPLRGICFDIQYNEFWLDSWGPKPESLPEAFAIARDSVMAAPRLIPIYSHRYLPDRPCEAGNPVFSVYQTDIIYYGLDLYDYIAHEFSFYFGRTDYSNDRTIREIEFWSELVE